MQTVTVIALGKLNANYYAGAAAEYARRLGAYCRLRVVELPEPERLANCAFDGAKPYAPPSPRKRKMAPLRMGAAAKAVLPVPDGGILPLMEARAPLSTTDRVAVYSWSAGRGVEMAGKPAVHILKLLTRDLP